MTTNKSIANDIVYNSFDIQTDNLDIDRIKTMCVMFCVEYDVEGDITNYHFHDNSSLVIDNHNGILQTRHRKEAKEIKLN